MRGSGRFVLAVLMLCLFAPSARAQQTPLSEILVRLIQADVRLATPPAGSTFPSHDAHFIPGEQEQIAPYFFNQAILSQLTTFPLGSSSGGFSYQFDPALGTLTRSTDSFGPAFAERALTIGRQRFNFGANYQHASYDTFEGKPLDDGSIKFYLTHEPVGGFFFEGDVIQTALRLNLTTDTVALFANYGITNRLDVGVAVPIVSVRMDASIDANVLRLATGTTGPTSAIHVFPNGTESATFHDSGSAKGIGDIVLRGKYRFLDAPGGGLAAGVDLRVPSGDADNLLGSGGTQAKIALIGSNRYDRLEPHFNVGYTFSGTSGSPFFNLADELNYTLGTQVVASPKLTVTADLIGRNLRNQGRLVEQPRTFNYADVAGNRGSTTVSEFARQAGNLDLVLGAAGVKFNVSGNLLISADVLFPLTQAGIRDRITPVIGFDYAF